MLLLKLYSVIFHPLLTSGHICIGERGADQRKSHRHQMSGSGEGGEGSLGPKRIQSQADSERVHTEGWHRLLRNLHSSVSGEILKNIDWYQSEEVWQYGIGGAFLNRSLQEPGRTCN